MKIFIDTAKLEEIEEAISWGIVDGGLHASIYKFEYFHLPPGNLF